MAALLNRMPEAATFVMLALHIATGAAVYVTVLALLYAPSLFKLLQPRQQFGP
jgi:hypothetical protein